MLCYRSALGRLKDCYPGKGVNVGKRDWLMEVVWGLGDGLVH